MQVQIYWGNILPAFLLTWNPNKEYPWSDLDVDIADLQKYGVFHSDWSCGNTKKIQPGDRIFMLRLGAADGVYPLGIVASGWATSTVYEREHWDHDKYLLGQTANYVKVAFDLILHPEKNHILLQDTLKYKFREQYWSPQNSGTSIKPNIISEVEKLWDTVITGQGLKQHDNYHSILPLIEAYDAAYHGVVEDTGQPESKPSSKNPEVINDKLISTPTSTRIDSIVAEDIKAALAEETFIEGQPTTHLTNHYERNHKLRAAALQYHGTTCQACGFSFDKYYGVHGKDFIEVHHLRPIASLGAPTEVNFKTDMAVLCSNCHSMVHRQPKNPLSIEQLKSIIGSARQINSEIL